MTGTETINIGAHTGSGDVTIDSNAGSTNVNIGSNVGQQQVISQFSIEEEAGGFDYGMDFGFE